MPGMRRSTTTFGISDGVRAAGDEILTQPSRSRESLRPCGPGNSPGTFIHGAFAQFEEHSRVLCTQPVTYKSGEWFHKTQSFLLIEYRFSWALFARCPSFVGKLRANQV